MSNEMIERVANALVRASNSNLEQKAKAAIEAMREPTEAMVIAYNEFGHIDLEGYRAMIDAALKDG